MGTRDLKIGTILDGMKWMRSCAYAVIATPSGSPERRARLAELTMATTRARIMAEDYRGKMAPELRMAIRMAEATLHLLGEKKAGGSSTGSDRPDRPDHPRQAMARMARRGQV